MRSFRYKNILLFGSPQFSGNISEYFIANTEKLVIYETMPRFDNKYNLVKLYKKGKQVSEEKVESSGNIFLYYFFWYITYLKVLKSYYTRSEKLYVITWQPFFLIGGSLQKMFRKMEFVYWVGDYFPPVNIPLKIYESVKKFYHGQVKHACYLSDRINKKMNGKVVNTQNKKTIMWGVSNKPIESRSGKEFTIGFVGVIKESQGIEFLLEAVKEIPSIKLKILGSGSQALSEEYATVINNYGIENRVYFPNKMYYARELEKEMKECFIGAALYEATPLNATYYADPGKIKTYAQYGVPILMTPIADIEKYVRKFGAGEVVEQDTKDIKAGILKMKRGYNKYVKGLQKFNEYFDYELYYKKGFSFLEG